ncbi:hypothetical protein KY320_04295, partial [Candidatus Woesearchaeota archaeon]|nr:hypothetical protein [Candidatus Woesearchaeota archaeon]
DLTGVIAVSKGGVVPYVRVSKDGYVTHGCIMPFPPDEERSVMIPYSELESAAGSPLNTIACLEDRASTLAAELIEHLRSQENYHTSVVLFKVHFPFSEVNSVAAFLRAYAKDFEGRNSDLFKEAIENWVPECVAQNYDKSTEEGRRRIEDDATMTGYFNAPPELLSQAVFLNHGKELKNGELVDIDLSENPFSRWTYMKIFC